MTGGALDVAARGRPEAGNAAARLPAPDTASLDVVFAGSSGRKAQLLPHAVYEVRAMYTSAVVRSPALLADFHVGVMARPGSLAGYALNAPPPGAPAPAGAPRLRYAQHSTVDDPYFPSLVDGTRTIDPTTDPAVYFLGQGILQTAHTAGYPPPLLDPFADGVSSRPVSSFADVPSAKLGAAAVEAALGDLFTAVTYDDPGGTYPAAPVIQDRSLTDNAAITVTRYYKWHLPFAATGMHLGGKLPLGRFVFDVRLLDSAGRIVASGGTARLLQAGANTLGVAMKYDSQGYVSSLDVDLGLIAGTPASPPGPLSPVLAPLAGEVLADFSPGTGPVALALAQNGDIWVANRTAGGVARLSSAGSPILTYAGVAAPGDVAISRYGDVWIADTGNDRVHRISQGGLLRDVIAVGDGPEALAIDTSGNVWVANSGDGTVTKLSHAGYSMGTFAVGGTPVDLRFDAAGNLRVVDAAGDLVATLSPSGAPLGSFPTLDGPAGLFFDIWDRLWVAAGGGNRLALHAAGGGLVADWPAAGARQVEVDAGQTAWTTAETAGAVLLRAWDGTEVASTVAAGPRALAIDDYRAWTWVGQYAGGAGTGLKKLATGLLLATGTTLAGSGVAGFADGTGGAARFRAPEGVAMDAAGNTYVADTQNHRIRKITTGGAVSTLAGSGVQGWTDGPGYQARFTEPAGIAVDAAGTVYVADRGSHTVRKITPAGYVSTLSGSGQAGSANGVGQIARFDRPTGIAVDSGGTVYVSEPAQNRIRKILPDGLTSTVGVGQPQGFLAPRGLAVDPYGNLVVADSGYHDIRMVSPSGLVSILTGDGTPALVNGPIAGARFSDPVGVCHDAAGNLYVLDRGNRVIRRVSRDGIVTTVGGDGTAGATDGPPLKMRFQAPLGLALNASGRMAVADTGNDKIRLLTPPGPPPAYAVEAAPTVSTLAGSGAAASVNGTGGGAAFNEPYGITLDGAGNLVVTQVGDSRIRMVTAGGVTATLTGAAGVGYVDDALGLAQFYRPAYPRVDALGNVVAGDQNHRLRYIDIPNATVSTLAGSGPLTGGYVDGPATDSARFSAPLGLAIDTAGNVFVADFSNHVIRKLDTAGNVSTYAGTAFAAGATDGPPGTGTLNGPHGLAIDAAGNLYTADFWGHRIRKILPGGTISTLAGGAAGYADGLAADARFNNPTGIAVDAAGNLFVSDTLNHRIRKLDTSGRVTTHAGAGPTGGAGAFANGTGPSARFNLPIGLAITSGGTLYVADSANHRIRKIVP